MGPRCWAWTGHWKTEDAKTPEEMSSVDCVDPRQEGLQFKYLPPGRVADLYAVFVAAGGTASRETFRTVWLKS